MRNIVRRLAMVGVVAAAALAGQTRAQAQVGITVQVGPPVYYSAYVPACPGPDFYWTPGYYAGTYWVPGRWMHREHYYDRDWDHRRYYRDYDRHWDRDRDFDHDRGWHRGWR